MVDDFAARVERRYQAMVAEYDERMRKQNVDSPSRDRLLSRYRPLAREQAERSERYLEEGKPGVPDPLPPGEYRTTTEVGIRLGRDNDEPDWLDHPYSVPYPSGDEEAELERAGRLVRFPTGTRVVVEGVHEDTSRNENDGTLCRYHPSISFGDGRVYGLTCDWNDEQLKETFERVGDLKEVSRVGRTYRHKRTDAIVVVTKTVGVGMVTHTLRVIDVGGSQHKRDASIEVDERPVSFPWDDHWEEVDVEPPAE